MMQGDIEDKIHSGLSGPTSFPISGYRTAVAWDASALGDFTFLSMLLIHQHEPKQAVEQSILVSPYLGEKRIRGASYAPLGLSLRMPLERTVEFAKESESEVETATDVVEVKEDSKSK